MSDILIKGMKMPTRCGRCDMCVPEADGDIDWHNVCCITGADIVDVGEKMVDCPLIELPPHGDLMDRDEFFAACPELVDGYKQIADGLVVIEAEEGET